jgi:creatinine amidohydrolase
MTALGDRVSPELVDRPTVLVPVGAVEQHGPHLPLDTDACVAAAVAARAAAATNLLVAPPVAYGASGEHEGFPGTVSIGHAALRLLLVELGRSAGRWAGRQHRDARRRGRPAAGRGARRGLVRLLRRG